MRLAIWLAALLSAQPLADGLAHAQPINTDRPDITYSPLTLQPGVAQVESGAFFAWDAPLATFFQTDLRFGLLPGLELRMETPIAVISGTSATSQVDWGFKWQAAQGDALALGVLGLMGMDTQGQLSSTLWLLAQAGLPANFTLTLNGGPAFSGPNLQWTGAATLAFQPPGDWQAYGEVARFQPVTASSVGWGVDAGLLYQVTDDAQWDTALFRGLDPAAPDWYLTTGLSLRWGERP